MKLLRRVAAFCFFVLCGCTAVEKASLRDCVIRVVPVQVAATFEQCGLDDKSCLDRIARERALIAADYVATCVESSKDADGN